MRAWFFVSPFFLPFHLPWTSHLWFSFSRHDFYRFFIFYFTFLYSYGVSFFSFLSLSRLRTILALVRPVGRDVFLKDFITFLPSPFHAVNVLVQTLIFLCCCEALSGQPTVAVLSTGNRSGFLFSHQIFLILQGIRGTLGVWREIEGNAVCFGFIKLRLYAFQRASRSLVEVE